MIYCNREMFMTESNAFDVIQVNLPQVICILECEIKIPVGNKVGASGGEV